MVDINHHTPEPVIVYLCYRKYELELELARSRLDMVHLDQQLLDAVQQKLDLSQQLELWQVTIVIEKM